MIGYRRGDPMPKSPAWATFSPLNPPANLLALSVADGA
jgi:hypothetical protein